MERGSWTDARLDDRFAQIDRRFDRVDQRFDRLDGEVRDLRVETREGLTSLRNDLGGEIRELRTMIFRSNITMTLGFLGVIAAIVARGA
jgi:hypothetical protein